MDLEDQIVQAILDTHNGFYDIELPEPTGPWTKTYVENLRRVRFPGRLMQESFTRLLDQYDFLSE